jgi:hypothetical protein
MRAHRQKGEEAGKGEVIDDDEVPGSYVEYSVCH